MDARIPPTSAVPPASWLLAATALLLLLSPHHPVLSAGESRSWTSSEGKVIEGSLVLFEDGQVTLKTGRGNFKFPLTRLSENDQKYIREWQAKEAAMSRDSDSPGKGNSPGHLGNFENLKLAEWPNSVATDFDIDQIQVVKEDTSGEYLNRSQHSE